MTIYKYLKILCDMLSFIETEQNKHILFKSEFINGLNIYHDACCLIGHGFMMVNNSLLISNSFFDVRGDMTMSNTCDLMSHSFIGLVLRDIFAISRSQYLDINVSEDFKKYFIFLIFTDVTKTDVLIHDYITIMHIWNNNSLLAYENILSLYRNISDVHQKFINFIQSFYYNSHINAEYLKKISNLIPALNIYEIINKITRLQFMEKHFREVISHIALYGVPKREDCDECSYNRHTWGICCNSDDFRKLQFFKIFFKKNVGIRCNKNDKFLLAKAFIIFTIEFATKIFTIDDVKYWMETLSIICSINNINIDGNEKRKKKRERENETIV